MPGILLLVALCGVHGQKLGSFFHHLTPSEGLSQSTNAYVHRDSRGFVWISSTDGLNRFDGFNVRVYRPKAGHPRSMLGQNVTSPFFEDRNGDLWFCTYEAVNCYRRRTDDFEHWQLRNPVTSQVYREDYYAFHLDGDGNFWLRLGDGDQGRLHRLDTRTGQDTTLGPLVGNRCFADTMPDGQLKGIYSFDFGEASGLRYTPVKDGALLPPHHFFTGEKQPSQVFYDLWIESGGRIWLAGDNGLTEFNPDGKISQTYPTRNSNQPVRAMALVPLNERQMVVSTAGGGLKLFDRNPPHFVPAARSRPGRQSSLSSDGLDGLYLDRQQNLWISDWLFGVNYCNLGKAKVENVVLEDIPMPAKPASFFIQGLAEDRSGRIWCATLKSGIYRSDHTGALQPVPAKAACPPGPLYNLYAGRKGIIWITAKTGVYWYDENQERFNKVNGSENLHLTTKVGLGEWNGRMLLSGQGFYEIKEEPEGRGYRMEKISLHPLLDSQWIGYFYQDKKGSLYCNTNMAATLVWKPGQDPRELPINNLTGCWEPPGSDTLWMTTSYGLVKLVKDTYAQFVYDESNGLPNQYLSCVVPGDTGLLWLASNKGILMFDTDNGRSRQLGAADGVWAEEFFRNVWLKAGTGEIWLGNRDVLNVLGPGAARQVAALPDVQITALKVNDIDWNGKTYIGECTSLEFPYSENTLSFEFVALEYSDPQRNRLKYRLDGYDSDSSWVEARPGGPGFARYAKISPGSYTFQIMAANSDGVWNEKMLELGITIHPPFWQRWWFIALMIAAGLGVGYLIYRYRVAQIRRTLGFKQRVTESEMKALRAQMNPHFIFNSLNSINAYILRNESATASGYLTGFARLMRQILDNSTRDTISLEEETAFLEDYLRAEAMRLEQNLDYQIIVADEVDTFATEIPSMILQPYVENAIWHGVSQKPGGGKITIRFDDEGGTLLVTVEDNGIGRKRARILREKRSAAHVSKGLKITEERLALSDQLHGTASSVTTIDLYQTNGQPAGTRVELRIRPADGKNPTAL